MQIGALGKIPQEGFNVVEVLWLNDCAPFRVHKKTQVSVHMLKRKQDN